ncbi:hypothetical protein Dimus_025352 [Dionaea muscipula]
MLQPLPMPVKPPPLHLHLLRTSLPLTRFPSMAFNTTRRTPGPGCIFARAFPFKLKYMGFHFSPVQPNPQSFSTRPFRPKPGSSPRYPRSPEIRASKSLIDDEAELSDWVTELRTGSHLAGSVTEDEKEVGKGNVKKRGRDFGSVGRDEKGMKRGRGGGIDDFGERDKKGFRDSRFSGPKNSRIHGRNGDGEGDFQKGRRDGRGMTKGSENGFGDFSRKGTSGFGSPNHSDSKKSSFRGRFESDDDDDDDDDDESDDDEEKEEEEEKLRDIRNTKGAVVGGLKRGGKEFESRNQHDRGGGRLSRRREKGGESDGSSGNEKSFSSFVDLIGKEGREGDTDSGKDDEVDEGEIKSRSSLFAKEIRKEINIPISPGGGGGSYLSETRFDQCAVSPLSLKGIKDAGYEKMTLVQEATLPVILKGKDVMAKAKTGTGKTVAFLLPSIEVVVNSPSISRDQKRPPILVLVICPTRELAAQAATEANTLLKYHPSIGVQVVIGGTRLAVEQKRMQANPCQILVATPGRLRDHLENTPGFATRIMGVKVLVLDEADHLLDMGFRKDIERIIAAVPKQRQTLLFSATIPEDVRQICHIALKRDHEFINAVQEGSEDTHSQVTQMHLVAPLEKHFPLLYVLLKEHISDDVNYKVLVFCTTAMVTRLVADLLGELHLNVREIHSRKPQSYRTRVSDEFRKSKGLILVTSDVSARGVDYPDVTLVIQWGLPSDREQYIHRLGRTGRKGKEGRGILLLAPWEEFFLVSIKDLPMTKSPVPSVDPDVKKKVERALSQVEMKNKEAAYQAWLGYYNSNKIVARDKYKLVELANEFSRCMGLDNPPAIPKLVVGKMGLKNVPGLRTK